MKYHTHILTIILVLSFFTSSKTHAQSYQFSKYALDDGLPQQYIYSLNQDNNGFIWVGTGDGLSKFDGIEFINYTQKDGLPENFITCSTQDSNGVIWLGHNKGSISKIIDGVIEPILLDSLFNSKITDIFIHPNGDIWASTQNGYLITINSDEKISKFDIYFDQKNINCISYITDSIILVGTSDGLYAWNLDKNKKPVKGKTNRNFKNTSILTISPSTSDSNSLWIGTDIGLHQLNQMGNSKFRSRRFDDDGLNGSSVKNIEEDQYNNLWVSTYRGLFKIVYDEATGDHLSETVHYSEKNGLSDYINKTLIDREGNAWIGTYGDGLAMLKDELFVFYSHLSDRIPNDTRSFYFNDDVKWFGLSSGLLKIAIKEEVKFKYYNSQNGFKDVAVTDILNKDGYLYLSTDGEGLIKFDTEKETFEKEYLVTSYLSNKINSSFSKGNMIWLATEGGLINKNLTTEETVVFNTTNGLTHNSIYDVLNYDGKIYMGSHSNQITTIKADDVSHKPISDEQHLMDISALAIDGNNNLWLATIGNGIFKQDKDSFIHLTSQDGLKSDYCYSIIADDYGGIWVGHRGGLSRISTESNGIDVFSKSNGITDDFNPRATYKDEKGFIWFGTQQRTIKFNPEKFIKNTIPPIVNIKNLLISDEKYSTSEPIELSYQSYKLKIDFIGISFKHPKGVKYQYFLEGHDLEWSESTLSNSISYPRIDDGEYTFKVKACNSDGFCSEETLGFKIIIASPFWKKWWFYFLMIILLSTLVIYVVKKREENQKIIRIELEKELEKRTTEVVKKSEEIEDKNKSITDSINYALRIQKAILPSISLMKENYPESFIHYQPRDIVSGDFYWYKKIGNNFIVICADCTGHGVPGAFMSMIASTLFKEIAHQNEVNSPSDFIYKIDQLLKSTLKRSGQSNIHDGLDLAICVLDTETNHMSFSGAYRPILLYKDKELKRIKTSSFSIGGDDSIKKEFITQEIQLEKGDIIYLFSDGYPDQFGGVKGKKLYLKGFENLILDLLELDMDEQRNRLKTFYKEWQGNNNQVDDVLVMGIKIS